MLANAGYITGETDIMARNPLITIKGLEYLSENTIMQRMYKAMKGIKDIVR